MLDWRLKAISRVLKQSNTMPNLDHCTTVSEIARAISQETFSWWNSDSIKLVYSLIFRPQLPFLVETFIDSPNDVGGTCPSPSHKYNNHCCCESGCCWEGCKKDKPPQSCLNGVPNSQWVVNTTWFDGNKRLYQAVRNFKNKGFYNNYALKRLDHYL